MGFSSRRRMARIKNQIRPALSEDGEGIEYVIYCRKSTDDEENQKTSIFQQLEKCFEYAEKNNLQLQKRDVNFPVDNETIKEIEKVMEKQSQKERDEFLQKYISHQIITEKKSAKLPFKRPLWTKLMQMIDDGKVNGLLSYSPDRNARNTTEGGLLITKADNQVLSLKYTNFQFENTPSGHMMLGIFFVFAEHYSKKLSEDSTRGQMSKFEEGKAGGVPKIGYITDDQDYYIPHPVHFPILKKAFQRKLYDNWSDTRIAEEMNASGWDSENKITANKISTLGNGGLWGDSFFYGVFKRDYKKFGVIENDLRELSGYNFQPAISEEEWFELQKKIIERNNKSIEQRKSRATQKLDSVMPLGKGIVIDVSQKPLNFSVPNQKRFIEKLKKVQETNPDAMYGDVIKSNQIIYSLKGNNINYSDIDARIGQILKSMKIPVEDYQKFLWGLLKKTEAQYNQRKKEEKDIQLMLNHNSSKRDKYISENNHGIGLLGGDRQSYDRRTAQFLEEEKRLNKMKTDLQEVARDEYLEQGAFFELFTNLPNLWLKANYVQKRKISEILLLNITVKDGKVLKLAIKDEFKHCFPASIRDGGGGQN